MNRHSHNFTVNPTLDLALDILARGPRIVVDPSMPESRVADWLSAAQYAVDGDCTDLNDLEEEFAEAEREANRPHLDEDQFWRTSPFAIDWGLGE